MDSFCGSEFWDSNYTWHTNDPDFTPCFQKTLLVWLPCGFLFLVSPCYVYHLASAESQPIKHTWLSITKSIIAVILVITSLVDLIWAVVDHTKGTPLFLADIFAPSFYFLAMIVATVLIQFCRKKGQRTSAILFIYWSLLTLAAIIILRS